MKTTLWIVRKAIAFIMMFLGFTALCCLDSDLPIWGPVLLIIVFFVGVIGGGALWFKGEDMVDIDK